MKNTLAKHLEEANMTYFQHLMRALRFSTLLISAGIACLVHAFLPFVFEKTASNLISEISKEI
tara:strand:- start:433 stop:621 length:189 start_codon:yes stop_codon:yes gene_type:complete